MKKIPAGWKKVIWAIDCLYEDWDTDHECPVCPDCKIDYSDCPCPGPTQEDIYEYKKFQGVLYARELKNTGSR